MKRLCQPCGHCSTCTGHKRRRAKIARQTRLLRAAVDELIGRALREETEGYAGPTRALLDRIDEEAKRR